MDWRVKGVVQKVLSSAPLGLGMKLNDVLQTKLGELKNFEASLESKVEDWAIHQGHLVELERPLAGLRAYEIGTGWFPTFPLCYALAGIGSVATYDLDRHLDERLSYRCLRGLRPHLGTIAEATRQSLDDVEARYRKLDQTGSLPELLHAAGVDYHAPADATRSGLPDDSVDIVFSNSVLEHVPPDVLKALYVESVRILKPGGLVVHSINCGDHYAYFDRGINFMNYLQFSESEWSFWNNSLQYQNRLRPQDFIDVTNDVGLKMRICKWAPKPDLLEALPNMKIAPEFRHYDDAQLASKSIDIVAEKVG